MNKLSLAFLLVLCTFCCSAQVNDAGLWASVNVEKKLSKDLELTFSEELRFNENVTELGTAFTEIGIQQKLVKRLTLGFTYRFIQKRNLDDSYSMRHRLMLDLAYRYKPGKWIFTLRERVQSQVEDVMSGEDGFDPVYYLRTKLTVKYDADKKYIPWASTELFYQLNNNRGNVIDQMRYAAGVDYHFNKRRAITLFYLINQEINVVNPVTDYVTGINYTYSF